ncbi:lipopolysaccharide biosynthesis protein [Pedococcus sp. NPDC057267]|uniref:lipopolysaccharide biosynthesis protein n=1 Tax=Pedococcus sp. NPDC057267 TaxID=3346077 RepID=UPI003644B162
MTGLFQIVRLAPQALAAGAIALLWIRDDVNPGHWLLMLGLAIAISSILSLVYIFRTRRIRASPRWLPPRELVVGARGAFVLVVGSQVIYQLDRVVVASRMDSRSVGYYAVSTAAAGACALFGQSVGMVTFSMLRETGSAVSRARLIRRGVVTALIITGCLSLVLVVVTPTLIRYFYGPEFLPASTATRILLVSSVPLAADFLLVHAALSVGVARGAARIQLLAGLLTVGLLGVATSLDNLALVSAVSVVAYILSAALLFRLVMRSSIAQPERS